MQFQKLVDLAAEHGIFFHVKGRDDLHVTEIFA